jgi:hypothetical protein
MPALKKKIRRMKSCHLQENDGTGNHHVKQNNPDSERLISLVFPCM